MNKILHGDSLELLKDMEDNSIDSIVTDPPYGYSFMGKDWDKAVPSVEMWEECLRVLKPGSFAFIMSAPRSDVQSEMIKRLEKAGFRVDFTPIYWTYATGFPKAGNIGKMIDKRLGKKGKVIGKKECGYQVSISKTRKEQGYRPNETNATKEVDITTPESDEAIKMNGSYTGFNPKPAVEVVIVVMKPLEEKSYLDQAMKNGKGVTWLDDCRIPFEMDDTPVGGYGAMDIGIGKPGETQEYRSKDYKKYLRDNVGGDKNFDTDTEGLSRGKHPSRKKKSDYDKYVEKQKSFKGAKTIGKVKEGKTSFLSGDMKQLDTSTNYQKKTKRQPRPEDSTWAKSGFKSEKNDTAEASPFGRFAANLLVQDDVLNDGKIRKAVPHGGDGESLDTRNMGWGFKRLPSDISDEGTFSRYFSLDNWWESRIQKLPLNVQTTYPFMIVPKASKGEKDKGMGNLETRQSTGGGGGIGDYKDDVNSASGKYGSEKAPAKNFHPTVKPLSLMSYLITLGSRKGDLVLDPFVGSGTTCVSAKLLHRKYIGMEMNDEYVVIAKERIKAYEPEEKQHDFF